MFRNKSYKHARMPTCSDDEFEAEETDSLHPLDTLSTIPKMINELFYLWALKIMKIGHLSFDEIPSLPLNLRAKVSYKNWKKVYDERTQNNRSISTLSMIWHTQKSQITEALVFACTVHLFLFVSFFVFKNNLWPELDKIDANNSNAQNVFKYAAIIFLIFFMRVIILAYGSTKLNKLATRIKSCLYLSLYAKTLTLEINECDKQSVLNLISTDIETIGTGMSMCLEVGVPLIVLAFLSILIMYWIVGISAIFGCAFMIFIGLPLQLFFGAKIAQYNGLRMDFVDKRIQLITESIRGIRVLKVCCYELPLIERVNSLREKELKYIKSRNFYLSLMILSMFIIPTLMLVITLIVYCFVFDHSFDSNITLFALMLFSGIQVGIRIFPLFVGYLVGVIASAKRVDKFHERNSVESTEDNNVNQFENDTAIEIKDGTFEWNANALNDNNHQTFSLNNISLTIKRGKLIAIIGRVGSGKTSLIQSILREMKCVSGELNVDLSDIVYLAQTPYIRNLTLRENIILELPFDEAVYKQCIVKSALISDLNTLPNFDLTIIGDEGVNLSGGQKMRVAFARTLYRKGISKNKNHNMIFIFDDPLSCVDIYVGRHMFLEGIYKYLMNSKDESSNVTCLMVINSHLHLLKYFDEIIVMDEGEKKVHSSVNDLFYSEKQNGSFSKYQHLLPNIDQLKGIQNELEMDCINEEEKHFMEDFEINTDEDCADLSMNSESERPTWPLLKQFIQSSLTKFDYKSHWFQNTEIIKQNAEMRNNSTNFMKLVIPLIVSMIILCSAPVSDLFVLHWNQQIENNSMKSRTILVYAFIWFMLVGIVAFGMIYSMHLFTKIASKSANYIHCKSLYNILRANILFFDLTPRGDIINRFSADTNAMDNEFVSTAFYLIVWGSSILGYLIVIAIFIPLAIIPIVLILPILIYFHHRFDMAFFACDNLRKKHDSIITTLFSETVVSLPTIRSYNLQSYFMNDLERRVDNAKKCDLMTRYLGRTAQLYFAILTSLMQFFVIMISILQIQSNHTQNEKQYTLLSLWYFMTVQILMHPAAILHILTKSAFSSIMRVMNYHHLFQENEKSGSEMIHEHKPVNYDCEIHNSDNNSKWPTVGNVDIHKLQLKYRKKFSKLQLDINTEIKIKSGDKVGICGRTGSGKSSILVSLFRLFEPLMNDTVIDGLRIDKLGLYDLRSNLSIISQSPVLFNGNLRFNLDPFEKYTDSEIWSALRNVQLFDLIQNRCGKLLCTVEEDGSNFSQGEKQLLCFARSMLLKSPLFFMDEATSSIDKNTDNIIQNLIRSEIFDDVTVICIAHRLQTIIDYDYILVLENGKIKQFDTPRKLLKDKGGDFYKLVQTDRLYHRM